jgi:competence protein ComEC
LIAGYQHGLPWFRRAADTSLGARVALWGGREIAGLIFASLLAGTATMPYAGYHFHRLAPYGVLANLLAMPIVSAWVMPAGLLAVVAIPFGFDAILWRVMADGIDWMVGVALWVAALPGAVGRIAAFGTGPLLLCTAGLIVLCLLRTPLRWCGAALIVAASLWALRAPLADIRIAADGSAVALRGADGRLSVLKTGKDVFAIREWLAADADARRPDDPTLGAGTRCDAAGCLGRLADGRTIALSLKLEAFADDCRRAAVVVSPREAPPDCAAMVIDRNVWRASGALELRTTGADFAVTAARPQGHERPWAGVTPSPERAAASLRRQNPPDATPHEEDLEAGD